MYVLVLSTDNNNVISNCFETLYFVCNIQLLNILLDVIIAVTPDPKLFIKNLPFSAYFIPDISLICTKIFFSFKVNHNVEQVKTYLKQLASLNSDTCLNLTIKVCH